MTIVRQTSFASGEISPSMWSRTETEQYRSGLRTALNFIVTPSGSVANRPGSRYCGAVKTGAGCGTARLVPFVFSDEQALVLEFGYHYVRFWLDGAPVMSGGSPYEVATPYGLSDLPLLRFAQIGNIITIACRGYDARELVRTATSPLTFTLSTITFDVPVCPVGVTDIVRLRYDSTDVPGASPHKWWWAVTANCQSLDGTRSWETAPWLNTYFSRDETDRPAWSSGTTYTAGDIVRYDTRTWLSLQPGNTGNTPTTSPTWWSERLWGNGVDEIDLADVKPILLWPNGSPTTYRIISWNLYRGQGGQLFGLVTVLPGPYGGTVSFQDDGSLEPDYLVRPPKAENPFKVFNYNHALIRTEKPTTVAYQDERLVFGGTTERPNYIFMSRTGDWHNFDQYPLVRDDDAIVVGLAGTKFEEIRSLVPGRSLLAFTTASEWALDGGQPGQPMIPSEMSARIRTSRGVTWLQALKVGDDHALFVQRKGNVIRDLVFDGQASTYTNRDMTRWSSHLLRASGVADWCWQEDPWSVVWVVLQDGSILSLTFVPEDRITGWSRHQLADGGSAESICSIPEGEEDSVYLVVNRGGLRTVERLASRVITDVRVDAVFLDSAVLYQLSTGQTTFGGLAHLNGRTVSLLVDGEVTGPYVVSGGICDATVGFPVSGVEPYGPGVTYLVDQYCTYNGYTWRSLQNDNTGHTPSAGAYWTYVTVVVGLPYLSDLETLDLPPGDGKTRVKIIREVAVDLEGSRGVWVGEDLDGLREWDQREVSDAYGVVGLFSGQVVLRILTRWNRLGRMVIRQVDPLPLTVLAVTRDVEYGGTG
jgi:hypothetical protein